MIISNAFICSFSVSGYLLPEHTGALPLESSGRP